MEGFTNQTLMVAGWLTLHVTVWLLVGTGLLLAITSRTVQFRHSPSMVHMTTGSCQGAKGGISSFQTFTISLATRVGVGNIFGMAAALLMGGPGAIFWMWIVALVGMAAVFLEATLAQIFKVRAADGSFRGGPAYYISLGMKNEALTTIFAIITVMTCAFVITSVQSNAITGIVLSAFGDAGDDPTLQGLLQTQLIIAALLFVFSAMVIFDGIRAITRVTKWITPIMATICAIMTAIIVIMNIDQFDMVLAQIIRGAATPAPTMGRLGGGIFAALINGAKRGLFSNGAGRGTVSSAIATTTVSYPMTQGLIQSLGVFVDTIVVCTAAAFVILIADPEVWNTQGANPTNLTLLAAAHELGIQTIMPMTILIFVLAYSSIIAAYVYSETNMTFVSDTKWAMWSVRIIPVFSVVLGALASLDPVWNTADAAMTVMTVTNLVALLSLSRWGRGALRDYERQHREKVAEPIFNDINNPLLPTDVSTDSWRG